MVKTGAILLALVLAPMAALAFTPPWSTVYGVARDERGMVDIAVDKALSTDIKGLLVSKDNRLGLKVKVYCFVGKVTLLGQLADEDFRKYAEAAASRERGVKGVVAYWEPEPEESTLTADLEIEARLRAALVGDKELSSTQVEIEVFSGKVYLLGMVRSGQDAERAVEHARAVPGVTEVVSLMTPSKP